MHPIPNESLGQPFFLSFKILDISTMYALLLTVYTLYTLFFCYSTQTKAYYTSQNFRNLSYKA